MEAIAITEFGGPERLEKLDLPDGPLAPKMVRVRVTAAGVNPADWKFRSGEAPVEALGGFPVIVGLDCAGTVEEVGADVVGPTPGAEVLAYCTRLGSGTYATTVDVHARAVAVRPPGLDTVVAAALPCAGLTAAAAVEAVAPGPGDTVLVLGAAGGVGHLAVQLARRHGATVIGTASAGKHGFVRSLGADHAVDYAGGDVAAQVRALVPDGVDAVIDTVGGAASADALAALRDGGAITSVISTLQGDRYRERSITATHVDGKPDGRQLALLAELVAAGELAVHIEETFPFTAEGARGAHERSESGRVQGKLVLVRA